MPSALSLAAESFLPSPIPKPLQLGKVLPKFLTSPQISALTANPEKVAVKTREVPVGSLGGLSPTGSPAEAVEASD
jgi:hypothetical protein